MIPVCLGVLLVLGMVGLFAGLMAWSNHTKNQSIAALAAAAQQLGLTLSGPYQASGPFGRGTLSILLTTEQRGSGKNRHTVRVTRYRVSFPASLRMGLKLSSQSGFFGDIADALGLVKDIVVGRPDLDRALRIGAFDQEHAARVLLRPDAAAAAIAASKLGRFYVRDDHAFAQHDNWPRDPSGFGYARPLGDLASALVGARETERAGWEQQVDAIWGRLSDFEGFEYSSAWTSLRATTPTTVTHLFVGTNDHSLVTTANVAVSRPLGHGIEVYRTGAMQSLGKLFGAQDVNIGVPAFDERFTIKASREAEARALLASVGADLLLLAESFEELRIVDGGLTATQSSVLMDETRITAILRALQRVAAALGGEGTQSVGAFR